MKFSQRLGYVPIRTVAQVESADSDLRTGLWNLVYTLFFEFETYDLGDYTDEVFKPIWIHLLNRDLDQYPATNAKLEDEIKKRIKLGEWYEVYDLVEGILDNAPEEVGEMPDLFNSVLETHHAGYRVLEGKVVPIADTGELKEIEQAAAVEHAAAQHHLSASIALLANRTNPDYPNSVKEAISAVEAFAASLTGKNTLGAAVNQLKEDGKITHPSLLDAWKKMYGYASDEDGIRHGGESAPEVSQELARYILITSSAFINLLTAVYAP